MNYSHSCFLKQSFVQENVRQEGKTRLLKRLMFIAESLSPQKVYMCIYILNLNYLFKNVMHFVLVTLKQIYHYFMYTWSLLLFINGETQNFGTQNSRRKVLTKKDLP